MNNIEITNNEIPDIKLLEEIYNNVGWTNYTSDLDVLLKAFYSSLSIYAAWEDKELVGIVRAVGDGMTIVYIQDIIVKTEYQRQGIGKMLLNAVLNEFKSVRQKVLLTDNSENTIQFYKNCGFTMAKDCDCVAFVKFSTN